MDKSHKRHIAKTLTWRFFATLDTILISWVISGNALTGIKIGIVEVITKLVLYYFHERFWFRSKVTSASKRHLYKTITWRVLGTLDTIIIAWTISGNPLTGLKIGAAEVITKMLLYYLHERIWYKIDFGLKARNTN